MHETKGNPTDANETKICEAFGSEKCPKLIEQCKVENQEIRQRALRVLCDELRNPLSVVECLKGPRAEELQALQCLAKNLTRKDLISRVRSAEAFAEASKDSNGKLAMLTEANSAIVFPALIKAARDESKDVQMFVFSCLAYLCEVVDGCTALIINDGVSELLRFLHLRNTGGYGSSLEDETATFVLRAITSCCSLEDGLLACLKLPPSSKHKGGKKTTHTKVDSSLPSAVDLCVELLVKENMVPAVAGGRISARSTESSRAIAFICFSETGRDMAIVTGAVEALVALLVRLRELSANAVGEKSIVDDKQVDSLRQAKLAAVNALSALTASDDAKLKFLPCPESVDAVSYLLSSNDTVVQLTTLKLVSNIVVYPATRMAMRENASCLKSIRALREAENPVFQRHARIAEEALLWEA